MGDAARALGRSLVSPPIDPIHIRRYVGDYKDFGTVEELVTLDTGRVPVNAAATGVDLERALQYGLSAVPPIICQQSGRKSGRT